MTKEEIRKQIKEKLNALPTEARKAESDKICTSIINSEDYKACTTLIGYMPLPDEVDILPVITKALQDDKTVFLPRITPGTSQMEFYRYDTASKTFSGSYGITEPLPVAPFTDFLSHTDCLTQKILVLVPGRAFTLSGKRLGRGKGFYDIYFSKLEEAGTLPIKKSGVCFACQLLADLPTTPDDITMDSVVSAPSTTLRDRIHHTSISEE